MNQDLHQLDEDEECRCGRPWSVGQTFPIKTCHVYISVPTRIQPLDQTRFTGNHVGALLLLTGLAYAHVANSLDTVGMAVCMTIRILKQRAQLAILTVRSIAVLLVLAEVPKGILHFLPYDVELKLP